MKKSPGPGRASPKGSHPTGQRPGFPSPYTRSLVGAQFSSNTRITPLQGFGLYWGALPRALPRATKYEPVGLQELTATTFSTVPLSLVSSCPCVLGIGDILDNDFEEDTDERIDVEDVA